MSLIAVTDENIFSNKYVVENWIKYFSAFSLSNGYPFFIERQKRYLDKDDWNITVRQQYLIEYPSVNLAKLLAMFAKTNSKLKNY